MKNALIWGLIIGALSGLWLFIMHIMGYDIQDSKASPYEYFSILIPIAGLFFGIKNYRDTECKGNMGVLEAIIQSFKILLFGGTIAIFAGIVYINYIQAGNNLSAFSGRMFGALLVGILCALAVSLLLATKSNKVD
ncbi:DUF4199 domain-containing protein [Mucilaginibacter sp.]|uniref:DUF4199 domain-containing protein n=1 Tax=Mucilaginibacter sp. TaxID=1882438 RepID=UPI0026113D9D|nr:DUF4199 domain-containing protein [Mucilaginibacter sp.]MDB4924517.1 hypothetical protein [Mucilaginibacter sp.]